MHQAAFETKTQCLLIEERKRLRRRGYSDRPLTYVAETASLYNLRVNHLRCVWISMLCTDFQIRKNNLSYVFFQYVRTQYVVFSPPSTFSFTNNTEKVLLYLMPSEALVELHTVGNNRVIPILWLAEASLLRHPKRAQRIADFKKRFC
jgi:hypothetical protein